MRQFALLPAFILWGIISLQAQGVGIGTNTPDPSSALDITSTNAGVLVPRMTTAQRELILSPGQGLLVFDITTSSFWFHDTNAWIELMDHSAKEVFRNGPDMIYMGMADSVGIGTMDPEYKLHVVTGDDEYGISHTNGTVDVTTYVGNVLGGYMGTRSQHPFSLYAGDGAQQFTLFPNGNIGINTAIPYYKLHLTGNSLFDGYIGVGTGATNRLDVSHGMPRLEVHPSNRPLYVTGDLGAASAGIEFRHGNGTQGIGFGFNTIYATGSHESQDLGLAARGASGRLLFSTFDTLRMSMTGNGNLGLGVEPNNKLDIHSAITPRTGTHAADRPLYVTGDIGVSTNGVEFRNNAGTIGLGFGANTIYASGSNASQDIGLTAKGTSGQLVFSTNGAVRMRLFPTGFLGIGVTDAWAPIHFASEESNRKIILFSTKNNDHQFFGFGMNTNSLRYQVFGTSHSHVFYAGTSASTSSELFRIKGTGNVTISGVIEADPMIAPTLLNGFVNLGPEYAQAGYYKDKVGRVHLEGIVSRQDPPNPDQVVFVLPVGYRPTSPGIQIFNIVNAYGDGAEMIIQPNGEVTIYSTLGGSYVLSGISFRAN